MHIYARHLTAMLMAALLIPADASARSSSFRDSLPQPVRADFETACVESGTPLAGAYVSSFVGWVNVLMIDVQGRYQFAEVFAGEVDAIDKGTVRRAGDRLELVSDGPNAVDQDRTPMPEDLARHLLVFDHDGDRDLLEVDELAKIGMHIHWQRQLGATDAFYRRVGCDSAPINSANGATPLVEAEWAALPQDLQLSTLETPVRAKIVETLPDSRGYDYDLNDDEIMVRIDRGAEDGIRDRMSLCTTAGAYFEGWAYKVEARSSTLLVNIPKPLATKAPNAPRIGTAMSTRQRDCTGMSQRRPPNARTGN
jgi:hypothetical protein